MFFDKNNAYYTYNTYYFLLQCRYTYKFLEFKYPIIYEYNRIGIMNYNIVPIRIITISAP